jgi:drug/metabolite transporter (DMT)-like permease
MLIGILAALLAAFGWSLKFIVPFVIGPYSVFDFSLIRFFVAGSVRLVLRLVQLAAYPPSPPLWAPRGTRGAPPLAQRHGSRGHGGTHRGRHRRVRADRLPSVPVPPDPSTK